MLILLKIICETKNLEIEIICNKKIAVYIYMWACSFEILS